MLGMGRLFPGISLHQQQLLLLLAVCCSTGVVRAAVQGSTARSIQMVNRCGPFLGVVVPNAFEMEPLLRSPSFSPAKGLPSYLDVAGTHYMNTSDLLAVLPFFFHGSGELIGSYFYLKMIVYVFTGGNTSRSQMIKRTITICMLCSQPLGSNLYIQNKRRSYTLICIFPGTY
jgi:hypothetical protein